MPRPKVSPEAQLDLNDMHIYGTLRFGLQQADRYLDGLRGMLDTVGENPHIGREREEVHPPIRLLPYKAHHIFYDVIGGTVVIIRVLHHTVDWMHEF